MNVRWIAIASVGFATTVGCSLFVDLGDLSGGSANGGSDSGGDSASSSDASTGDAAQGTDADTDGSTTAYASTVLADAPVAYYRFEDTSGTVIHDSSGNGHDATTTGSVTLGGAGAFSGSGTCAHFNGDALVSIDDSANDAGTAFDFVGSEAFTLEAWVEIDRQPGSTSDEFTLFSKEAYLGSGNFHGIDFFADPSLVLQREDDPIDETEADGDKLGGTSTWYYLVATFDGTRIVLYVDLNPVASKDSSSTTLPLTNVPFLLGAENTNRDSSLVGSMDEVAVYDHALTPTQLAAHFHAAGR